MIFKSYSPKKKWKLHSYYYHKGVELLQVLRVQVSRLIYQKSTLPNQKMRQLSLKNVVLPTPILSITIIAFKRMFLLRKVNMFSSFYQLFYLSKANYTAKVIHRVSIEGTNLTIGNYGEIFCEPDIALNTSKKGCKNWIYLVKYR